MLVVAIEVRPDGGADLLDVLEDPSENDLLLQRADEALGDAVGFRLTDESEAEEPQLVLEVLGNLSEFPRSKAEIQGWFAGIALARSRIDAAA